MGKIYTALGLMSGTSMDGVDASLSRSNGTDEFTNILSMIPSKIKSPGLKLKLTFLKFNFSH